MGRPALKVLGSDSKTHLESRCCASLVNIFCLYFVITAHTMSVAVSWADSLAWLHIYDHLRGPSTAVRPTSSYGPWWTASGLACTTKSMPSPTRSHKIQTSRPGGEGWVLRLSFVVNVYFPSHLSEGICVFRYDFCTTPVFSHWI